VLILLASDEECQEAKQVRDHGDAGDQGGHPEEEDVPPWRGGAEEAQEPGEDAVVDGGGRESGQGQGPAACARREQQRQRGGGRLRRAAPEVRAQQGGGLGGVRGRRLVGRGPPRGRGPVAVAGAVDGPECDGGVEAGEAERPLGGHLVQRRERGELLGLAPRLHLAGHHYYILLA